MMEFAEFLKKKFFEEGEKYAIEKRKQAQEKMDNDEIGSARRSVENIQ